MEPQLKIPWTTMLIVCSLLLLLFLFPPFLQNGLILGHDTLLHASNIHAFDHAFFQGQFPVRVADWFFPGANIPLFNFYQPGFFYVMALFKLVGFSYSSGLNTALLGAWIGSGVFMYLFVKEQFANTLAGLISGLLYIFAPYHIVDIFVRAAFPEFMGLAVVPAWFWAATKFAKTGKSIWLAVAAGSIAALLIVHPITAAIFFPLIAAYTILLAWKKKSRRLFWHIAGTGIIGTLLAAFFLVPAFAEQPLIHGEITTTAKLYDFHNHFVCISQFFTPSWGYGLSVKGCNDSMSFQLGIVHWIAVVLSVGVTLYLWIFPRKSKKDTTTVLGIVFCILLFWSLYMGTSFSLPIWENLPFMHLLLYPWRFLALSIFTSSFLAGYSLSLLHKKAVLIVCAACLYGILYWYVPFLHANISDANSVGFNNNNFLVGNQQYMQTLYIPDPTFFPKVAKKFPNPRIIPQSEAQLLTGKGSIEKTTSTADEKTYTGSFQTQSVVRFYIIYFPGWEIRMDGNLLPVRYANPSGYMETTIPPGNHSISVKFTDTPLRRIADWISLLTICLLPLLYSAKLRQIIGVKIVGIKKSER